MQPRRWGYAVILSLTMVLFSVAARADSIDITLMETSQSGLPGTTVTFDATITNLTGATIFLNSSGNATSTPFLTVDGNPFLTNAPLSLAPGASSGPLALFSVIIAPGITPGVYDSNKFYIVGGTTSGASDMVGSAEFNVAVAPEPGTLVLLASGLLGLGFKLRFRSR